MDTTWEHFRIYSLFRSSLNSGLVAYLVTTGDVPADESASTTIIDNGSHLSTEDVSRILYLGSQPLCASTLTHKDQTLFLGDLKIL